MLEILFSLLILCLILGIVFWLLGMVLAGIPGCPPFVKPLIIAIVALIALMWLFGGYVGDGAHSSFGLHRGWSQRY
jgi:hypothetical protein